MIGTPLVETSVDQQNFNFQVIYQTWGRVFHQDFQTPRSGLKKRGAANYFFNRLQDIWIHDETLIWVFDNKASQTDH